MELLGSDTYFGLAETIAAKFEAGNYNSPQWKLIGLLFAREGDELVSGKLEKHFDYFNERSGDKVDFYWIGWGQRFDDTMGSPPAPFRIFNASRFARTVADLEEHTNWTYLGGVEVLLFASYWNPATSALRLDLGATMRLDLRAIEADKIDPDVLFEEIFRRVNQYRGEQPMFDLFLDRAKQSISQQLWSVVKSLLPGGAGDSFERLSRFALRDVSKRGITSPKRLGPPTLLISYDGRGGQTIIEQRLENESDEPASSAIGEEAPGDNGK
jgi:hypothetical protein